jgi:hypothetical protein
MPNADQMVRVAKALGTTVEYLVTGKSSEKALTRSQERWLGIVDGMDDEMIEEFMRQIESWLTMAAKLRQ